MFWGSQWQKQVIGGDFEADASFKGYADTVVGGIWNANPGNSSGPPAVVANYIHVIVSTMVGSTSGVISGNVAEVVVLKVDNPSAYKPDPGHQGTGLLVAVVR